MPEGPLQGWLCLDILFIHAALEAAQVGNFAVCWAVWVTTIVKMVATVISPPMPTSHARHYGPRQRIGYSFLFRPRDSCHKSWKENFKKGGVSNGPACSFPTALAAPFSRWVLRNYAHVRWCDG